MYWGAIGPVVTLLLEGAAGSSSSAYGQVIPVALMNSLNCSSCSTNTLMIPVAVDSLIISVALLIL